MNSRSTTWFVSVLIIMGGFLGFITFETEVVSAGTILYVGGGGMGNYSSIQWAIDNASEGDTVFVYNGIYDENLVVNKSINLTGEDRNTTIINGGRNGDVIFVNVNWVNITGFSITYSGQDSEDSGVEFNNADNSSLINNKIYSNGENGLILYNSSGSYIHDNIVTDNNFGISLFFSSGTIITNNYVSNNDEGISLKSSFNNNITSNFILNNYDPAINIDFSSNNTIIKQNNISNNWNGMMIKSSYNTIEENILLSNSRYGMYFDSSSNNNITNNDLINNGIFLNGIQLSHFNSHNISNDNLVNGKPLYFYKDSSAITIDNQPVGQLILVNCTDMEIKNLEIEDTYVAIEIAYSTKINITGNNISNNWNGLYLIYSSNNNINGNRLFSNSYDSLVLESSWNNIVNYNNLSFNTGDGIEVYSSFNNSFTFNDIIGNQEGIVIDFSHNNTINNNTISSNEQRGMRLYSCSNNTISGNNISYNDWVGISFYYSSSNNTLTRNNFYNNGNGLILSGSSYYNITKNSFVNDGVFINGYQLSHLNSHYISSDNIVNGKPLYYYKDKNGIDIDSIPVGQIILANCTNVNLTNIQINNTEVGIMIQYSRNINIINSNISNNDYSIYIRFSSNNSIINCTVTSKELYGYGIYLLESLNNMIKGNTITNNEQRGIYLESTSNNTISNNNISDNGGGIRFEESMDNTIIGNNITNNLGGISVYLDSSANITDNIITMNTNYGIVLSGSFSNISANRISFNGKYGIYLTNSLYSNISNNDFVNNGIFIEGNQLSRFNSHTISDDNIVNGKPLYYYKDRRDLNIDGNLTGQLILVNCTNINISNLSINNTDVGIEVSYSNFINITGNNISNNYHGIYIYESSNNNISKNTVLSNKIDGIYIYLSSTNVISGNNISFNEGYGLFLKKSLSCKLTNNHFLKDGIIIAGWDFMMGNSLLYYTSHDIPTNNKVNGKSLYYYKNSSGINIDGIQIGQLILVNCTNMNIRNLQINNTDAGILIAYSSNINITQNILSNNYYGIYLDDSSNNNISLNDILNNGYGILLGTSFFSKSQNNLIMGNTISYSTYYGIYIGGSYNNKIFHNNFIENVNHAYIYMMGVNYWNDTYPSGGNYWSDHSPSSPDLYNGAETPQTTGLPDGICDVAYVIEFYRQDFYPLKYPWGSPSPPLNLTAKSGISYINITWDAPISDGGNPVMGYKVYRSKTSGQGELIAEIVNDTRYFNDTSMIGGILYYYTATAFNDMGEGQFSNEVQSISSGPPLKPQDPQVLIGDSYINLSWNPPDSDGGFPITNYRIYRRTSSEPYTLFTEIGNVLFYNDTDVSNGITYFYKVTATNSIGEGPYSNEVIAKPGTTPSAPLSPTAVSGNSYVQLSWNAPVSDGGFPITGYKIYKGETSGEEEFLTEVEDIFFYNDTKVINGLVYYYKISAFNERGEGPLSLEVNAKPVSVPSKPTGLSATSGESYVHIEWNPPTSNSGSTISSYNIYRGTSSGEEIFLTEVGNVSFFNDTNVTNGLTYFYKVSAINEIGEGPLSNEVSATPGKPYQEIDNPPSCSILNPISRSTVSETIVISGTASDPEGTYLKVEINIDNGQWFPVNGNTSSWSYTWDTKTVSNGPHTIYARAQDNENYSPESSVDVFVDNPSSIDRPIFEETWFFYLIVLLVAVLIIAVLLAMKMRKKPSVENNNEKITDTGQGIKEKTEE